MIFLALFSGLDSIKSQPAWVHLDWNRHVTDGGFKATKSTTSFYLLSQSALLSFSIIQQLLSLIISSSSQSFLSRFAHFSVFLFPSRGSSHPAISEVTLIVHTNTYKNHHRKIISLQESTMTSQYKHGKNTHTKNIIIQQYGHWLWAFFYIANN